MASSREIEREVESQRANVESTLDALKNKMSMGQIVDEMQGYIGADEAREAMRNVGRQVRDNPIAIGLVGVGLAWLMFGGGGSRRTTDYDDEYGYGRRGYDDRSSETYPGATGGARYGSAYGSPYAGADDHGGGDDDRGSALSRAARGVSDAVSGVGERISSAVGGVGDTLDQAREAGGRRARRLGEAVSDHAPSSAGLSRRGREVQSALAEAIERQPLLVGVVAVAAGAAIGAALPSTRVESRWLGDAREGLVGEAKRAASSLREQATAAAEAGFSAAAEAADREGLLPETGGRPLAERVEAAVRAGVEGAKENLTEGRSAETERA